MHEYSQKLGLEIVSQEADVRLKHFCHRDAVELFQLIEENRKHLSQYGERIAEKYPTLTSLQNALILIPGTLFWFGVRNRQNVLMGSVSLINHWKQNHVADIGYWLGSRFTGNRYMTDAVTILTKFAFANFDIIKITAEARFDNSPSIKVLANAGFEYQEPAQTPNYLLFAKLPRVQTSASV